MGLADDFDAYEAQQRQRLSADFDAFEARQLPADQQVTTAIRNVRQQSPAVDRIAAPPQPQGIGMGDVARMAMDPTALVSQYAQRAGAYGVEHPREAVSIGASMAPGIAAGLLTDGASVPIQLGAQFLAGGGGELARQAIMGEDPSGKQAALSGITQMIPIHGGPVAAAGKAALVSEGDLLARSYLQNRTPSPEEMILAPAVGGLMAGGLTAAGHAVGERRQALAEGQLRARQNAADVAGGTDFPQGDQGWTGTALHDIPTPLSADFDALSADFDAFEQRTPMRGAPPPVPDMAERAAAPPSQRFPLTGVVDDTAPETHAPPPAPEGMAQAPPAQPGQAVAADATIPPHIQARVAGEASAQTEGQWQRLMQGDQTVAAQLTPEEAQGFLRRLDAAPGDNPQARAALEQAAGPTIGEILKQKATEERGSVGIPGAQKLSDLIDKGRAYVGGLRDEGRKLEQEALEQELSEARQRPFPGAVGDRGYGPGTALAPGTDRSQSATVGAMSSVDKDSLSPSLIRGDIDNVLNRVALVNRDDMEWARRGQVSVKLTQMRADELAGEWAKRIGVDASQVARMRERGQVPNAEEMLAMLHVSERYHARSLRHAATAEKTGLLEDTLKAAADAATSSAVLIQAQAGASELGRAMNILRTAAYGPKGSQNAAIRQAVKYFGGTDDLERIVTRIRMYKPEETDLLNRYMATVAPKRWGDKLLATYYAALLANIPGRVNDFVSTGMMSTMRIAERAAAAGVDTGLSAMRGTPRTRFLSDAGYDLMGHYAGLRKGVRVALRTLVTQQPAEGFSRFREIEASVRPFKSELVNTLVGVPRSIIEASDEFHKTVTESGFIYGEASKIASTEGLTGQRWHDRVAEIIEDPRSVDGLWQAARQERQFRTFQDELGPFGRKFLSVVNAEVPDNPYAPFLAGLRPVRFVVPFFRTTVKLQKAGILGAYRAPLLAAQAAMGRLPKDQGQLSDEIAKAAIASAIAGAAMAFVAEGYISGGGPLDPKEAEALRATGWWPNSVNFGGTDQYEYRRFEPFGTTVGILADLHDGWPVLEEEDSAQRITDYVSQALSVGGSSLLKQGLNAPYVKGVSDFYDALDDPKRYLQSFVNNQVAAFIPGFVRQSAIANDPTVRKPTTLLQTIQARIPGLTGGVQGDIPLMRGADGQPMQFNMPPVPPMIDIWGRDVVRKGGFWEILTSPAPRHELFQDPASRAIRELGWKPGSPSRALVYDGQHLKLSDEAYTRYARTVGDFAFRYVTQIVESGQWDRYNTHEKRAVLSKIWKAARKVGKAEALPELKEHRAAMPDE